MIASDRECFLTVVFCCSIVYSERARASQGIGLDEGNSAARVSRWHARGCAPQRSLPFLSPVASAVQSPDLAPASPQSIDDADEEGASVLPPLLPKNVLPQKTLHKSKMTALRTKLRAMKLGTLASPTAEWQQVDSAPSSPQTPLPLLTPLSPRQLAPLTRPAWLSRVQRESSPPPVERAMAEAGSENEADAQQAADRAELPAPLAPLRAGSRSLLDALRTMPRVALPPLPVARKQQHAVKLRRLKDKLKSMSPPAFEPGTLEPGSPSERDDSGSIPNALPGNTDEF